MGGTKISQAACLLVLVAMPFNSGAAPQPTRPQPSPIFRFYTDEFWLNLHHFLYVLGRAQAGTPDSKREAVVHAPGESEAGLVALSPAERETWRKAVEAYANGMSKMNLVFDEPLSKATRALASATDSADLQGVALDADVAKTLADAAPIYGKVWWPAHHAANVARRDELQTLVAKYGSAVLALITRAYGMQWSPTGFAVHLSGYAGWAGAYSTAGELLVVSSLDQALAGEEGLETIFHEGMHQWDDEMIPLLDGIARPLNASVPHNLSHAMIFFTAGEAVRSVFPSHVPYAEKYGVWKRGWEPLQQALEETWKPYLDGKGTRDQAIAALLKRCRSIH